MKAIKEETERALQLLRAVEAIQAACERPFYEVHLDRNGAHLFTGSGWENTRGGLLVDAIIAIVNDIPKRGGLK